MDKPIFLRKLADERVCIHWFQICADGPIQTRVKVEPTELGPIRLGGVRGKIACNPAQNTVLSQERAEGYYLCCHSDDVRAVTCEDCSATPAYQEQMAKIPK